jgi:2,3-bisphosphoglycerate-independent phosphoglycerate mutase
LWVAQFLNNKGFVMSLSSPVLLCILDGWGHGVAEDPFNAIVQAHTPHFDHLWANAPHALLSASGPAVGLPEGQMGNSEVGHMHLSSGRVVLQDLQRIDSVIDSGQWFDRPEWRRFVAASQNVSGRVHVTGLLSTGGVHAHLRHWLALIDAAYDAEIRGMCFHVILDGRDMPPRSARPLLIELNKMLQNKPCGRIVSMVGRYYAMDRDQRFERNQLVAEMMQGRSSQHADHVLDALDLAYAADISDEFVLPTWIGPKDSSSALTADDLLLHLNFRADRAGQFLRFLRGDIGGYQQALSRLSVMTMTAYPDFDIDLVLFDKLQVEDDLGACISDAGMKQLRITETEKYAHVTYFFNGGKSVVYPGESRVLIPSPKVKTYDLAPQMSAVSITDALIKALEDRSYDFLLCNFANADMVGHTGDFKATCAAIELLDECLGRLDKAVATAGGHWFITADHGNAEALYDARVDQAITSHTCNPVPFIYRGPNTQLLASSGTLAQVAPTVLSVLRIPRPTGMTCSDLWIES